ncbi:glycosyltransferase [Corynebacterium qintianiae]|uniref:glycosyltransferase n=1 Tax=Corynebacterium qintianiae TaxID=2709392 RepID=UPI0013EC462D|nr:glycosyltransferase [Corynebacterium qintianiae]
MLSALWKARRLHELGYDVEIRLFEHVLDFKYIKKPLVESGQLLPDIPVTNIHEFLETLDEPATQREATSELEDLSERDLGSPDQEINYGPVVRYRSWDRPDSAKLFAEYFRPDGSLYMRAFTYDRSLMKGAAGVDLHNGKGERTRSFSSARELWAFWLRFGLEPGQPLVVIQDGMFLGELGMEMLSSICEGPNVVNMAVAHGATLSLRSATRSVATHGWDAKRRFGRVDRMVFLTDEQREHWREAFPDSEGLVTIPHECRTERIEFLEQKSLKFVTIASLTPLKRVDHVLRAFADVKQHSPLAQLEVYGAGPEEASLKRLRSDLGLDENVHFMGYSLDAQSAFSGAAASIITSEREAFGMPILESMSVGTPVIAYDIDYGPRYIIRNGVDGTLVESGDVDGLSQAMKAIADGGAEVQRLRRNAVARAKEFSGDAIGAKWDAEIRKVLMERGLI